MVVGGFAFITKKNVIEERLAAILASLPALERRVIVKLYVAFARSTMGEFIIPSTTFSETVWGIVGKIKALLCLQEWGLRCSVKKSPSQRAKGRNLRDAHECLGDGDRARLYGGAGEVPEEWQDLPRRRRALHGYRPNGNGG